MGLIDLLKDSFGMKKEKSYTEKRREKRRNCEHEKELVKDESDYIYNSYLDLQNREIVYNVEYGFHMVCDECNVVESPPREEIPEQVGEEIRIDIDQIAETEPIFKDTE